MVGNRRQAFSGEEEGALLRVKFLREEILREGQGSQVLLQGQLEGKDCQRLWFDRFGMVVAWLRPCRGFW